MGDKGIIKKKKKSPIVKTIKIITNLLYVAFFAIGIYIIFTAYRGQVPSLGKYKFLKIAGESMVPTFNLNQCIIIKKADAKDVKVGDIITFYSDDPAIKGYPNTHRVVEINEKDGKVEFVTKGDANKDNDLYTVREEQLLGRYQGKTTVADTITKLFNVLSDRKMYYLIMVLPVVICILFNLSDLIKIFAGVDEEYSNQ